MGLDTTHRCWNGAYSAFFRWRKLIAEVSGYGQYDYDDLDALIPAGESKHVYSGEWKKQPEDIILVLLLHSDCDGVIPKEFCAPLADRLEGLLPNIRGDLGGHIGDVKNKTVQFIKGLRLASAEGEEVEFH